MTTTLASLDQALNQLKAAIRGPVIRPSDPGYDEARRSTTP